MAHIEIKEICNIYQFQYLLIRYKILHSTVMSQLVIAHR